jgi:hypothetical protein
MDEGRWLRKALGRVAGIFSRRPAERRYERRPAGSVLIRGAQSRPSLPPSPAFQSGRRATMNSPLSSRTL